MLPKQFVWKLYMHHYLMACRCLTGACTLNLLISLHPPPPPATTLHTPRVARTPWPTTTCRLTSPSPPALQDPDAAGVRTDIHVCLSAA